MVFAAADVTFAMVLGLVFAAAVTCALVLGLVFAAAAVADVTFALVFVFLVDDDDGHSKCGGLGRAVHQMRVHQDGRQGRQRQGRRCSASARRFFR